MNVVVTSTGKLELQIVAGQSSPGAPENVKAAIEILYHTIVWDVLYQTNSWCFQVNSG